MTFHARRKRRARARKAASGQSYTASRRRAVGTSPDLSRCPSWCVEHQFFPDDDDLDPTDTSSAWHKGRPLPVGRSLMHGDTAIALSADLRVPPHASVIIVILCIDQSYDLWWSLPEAAVLHAALSELLAAAELPLDPQRCLESCSDHVACEPDSLDPSSLSSVLHFSTPIPVPSVHQGEMSVQLESDIETDGQRRDMIVICTGGDGDVYWGLDTARAAKEALAVTLRTAATDPLCRLHQL